MSSRRALLFAVLASVLLGSGLIAPPASAAGYGKAGVVVVHGDGTVTTRCVRLTKAEISGYRLLQRSKFQFQAAAFGFGHAICQLDSEGVPTTDPSTCLPKTGPTWGYFTQDKGQSEPTLSNVGLDDRTVTRKSIDYWVFATPPQKAPAAVSLRDICSS